MDSKKYISDALVTESVYGPSIERMADASVARLTHGLMGLVTEAAEGIDVLKKHIYYGKPIDYVNLKEELGDLFWYMAILCDELGTSFEAVMQTNIAKLRARYGEKFSSERAINRNLDAEKAVLESES